MTSRLNETFIELMEKMSDIMLKHGEPFRARAYQKAQETIMSCTSDILSPNQLKGKPNIGSTIMEKLNEYVETGTLKILEREKTNPVNILADVYGIGPKKAKELVDNNITSISDLRMNQHLLNDIQKVGLKYYEDVLKRIPRNEIEEYKVYFNNAKGNANMEIVGSYRRGAESSGDIDVIITSKNPNDFTEFVDNLVKKGIILNILSRGPTKCLVMAKISNSDTVRRVDFLYTTPEEFPFAILYFTGSKIFNTVMRHFALEKGYTMNEHGIYEMDLKKKGKKVEHVFTCEKDIFNFLGLEYKTPIQRTDGRAVISKKKFIIENEDYEEEKLTTNNEIVIATEFKQKGISVLKKYNETELTSLLQKANDAYYNKQSFLTDEQYDIIKEYMEVTYPNNNAIFEIGAPVERNKVQLPYFMGSMDKIKPDTNSLSSWTSKFHGPYILSCKLDGVSGLYTTQGSEPKLYTRGDGVIGQDISHLIPFLRLPKIKDISIRGEFIIPKSVFELKYKNTFANPRNMVAGIINHKTINESIKDVHFVAYEVICPSYKPSNQMSFLSTLDVEVVLYELHHHITNDLLSQTLVNWRENYIYEIDGIIVSDDKTYTRKIGNPEHAFAFKMVLSDQIVEAKVVDVLWTASKDGYLKPRVQIEPINLGGVLITYATGFNGAFIRDNKIGVGSVVELIRSGDVIPYIRKVIVAAEFPKMPNVNFIWNATEIDIMLEDVETNDDVKEKNITRFFKGIGVEGLSSGNVRRIMDAGYDNVPSILRMEKNDFLKVDGFQEKTSSKLYNGIREKIELASLITIMSSSNMFGRGFSEKKIELIMHDYPSVLLSKETYTQKITRIANIKGMAEKTAELFVERIPSFITFMKESGLVNKMSDASTNNVVDESHLLFGKSIVMTGFRDTQLQDILKNIGAKLGSSVSSKTFVVLVKDKNEDTGKTNEARKLNIPIMTPQEFKSIYLK
jgi:DNA ligase (NAD+)